MKANIATCLFALCILNPLPVFAQSCVDLWKERNGMFHTKGYCFEPGLAQSYFGNENCFTNAPELGNDDIARLAAIKQREGYMDCASQKRNWTLATLGGSIAGSNAVGQPGTVTDRVFDRGQLLEVQAILKRTGFYNGRVDGVAGPATTSAVAAYLGARGHAADMSSDKVMGLLRAEKAMIAAQRAASENTTAKAADRAAQGRLVRPAPDSKAAAQMREQLGMMPAMVEFLDTRGKPYYYFAIEKIQPGSWAANWGLTSQSMIIHNDKPVRLPIILTLPTNATTIPPSMIDAVIDAYLSFLNQPGGMISARVVPIEEFARFRKINKVDMSGYEHGAEVTMAIGASAASPLGLIVDHIGFDMDKNLIVTKLIPNSPADIAGVKLRDRWGGQIGNGSFPAYRGRSALLKAVSNEMTRYADTPYTASVRFIREGKPVVLWFPTVKFGQTQPLPQLNAEQKELFALLPHELSQFFTFLYLGDFKTAKMFQMALFDKHFRGSSLAFVSGALGKSGNIRKQYEAARGRGVMSQYILIKSNRLGMCGQAETAMRVEQKRYEVWKNQWGVETSARREIEPNVYEFSVPTRWAPHLEQSTPMGEAYSWARGIAQFVEAAGGCDSAVLDQLEQNMLSYVEGG